MSSQLKILFAGQIPKEPSFPEANEDYFEISLENGRVAVSDGASESFDSKTWANLLVNGFIKNPELNPQWLPEINTAYHKQFDLSQLSWSKQAAYDRGSFATLIGIEFNFKDNSVEVLSVGDSIAVLLDGSEYLVSFPYKNFEEFQQRPDLLSTNATLNSFVSSSDFFLQHHRTWSLNSKNEPIVLCMTDALGEWALRKHQEGTPVWDTLISVREVKELEDLVVKNRQDKQMRVDDTTLVTLSFRMGEDELSNS